VQHGRRDHDGRLHDVPELWGFEVRLPSTSLHDRRALERQKVEPTVIRYIGNAIAVALNVLLVIGILGYFGVETTSFAALIAALGIAIGAAWSGCSRTSRRGAFILVLRPFKVGDYVLAGDVEGTVRAIGLFTTSIDSHRTTCRPTSATRRSWAARSRTSPRTRTAAWSSPRSSPRRSIRTTRSGA
jgi:small-conductance mechanosensitive channel